MFVRHQGHWHFNSWADAVRRDPSMGHCVRLSPLQHREAQNDRRHSVHARPGVLLSIGSCAVPNRSRRLRGINPFTTPWAKASSLVWLPAANTTIAHLNDYGAQALYKGGANGGQRLKNLMLPGATTGASDALAAVLILATGPSDPERARCWRCEQFPHLPRLATGGRSEEVDNHPAPA